MNIFELNSLTETNILLYQQEMPIFVMECLLRDGHWKDAIVLYNIYKWTSLQCTCIPFLQWIQNNHIHIELTKHSILQLIQNGDKEVLHYIDPQWYIEVILFSPWSFIQYVFEHYDIVLEEHHLIHYCKFNHKKNNILFLMKHCPINKGLVMDCMYYLCHYDTLPIVKELLSCYPNIPLKPFFIKAITYNQYDLSYYFLSLDSTLIQDINITECFIQHSYKTLQLLYTLDKSLFSNINHNYIFSIISRDVVDNKSSFMSWYLTHFKYYIEYNMYQEHMNIMKSNGYVYDEVSEEYFINACLKNYVDVVKKYQCTNYTITRIGFELACLYGYFDIVQYLSQSAEKNHMYIMLQYLITIDTMHLDIVKYLFSQVQCFPPELAQYFCKHGYIDSSFNIDDECIYWLCINGHFEVVYNLMIENKIANIEDAFLYACEYKEGLFLAKWIYHRNALNQKLICKSFFNANHIDTLRWLHSLETIPIFKNNHAYFKERCIHQDYEIVDWLCNVYPNYSYELVHGYIMYHTELIKIFRDIETTECSICMETNANSMTLCKHSFCYDCINKWYQKSNTCPMCRSPIEDVFTSIIPP